MGYSGSDTDFGSIFNLPPPRITCTNKKTKGLKWSRFRLFGPRKMLFASMLKITRGLPNTTHVICPCMLFPSADAPNYHTCMWMQRVFWYRPKQVIWVIWRPQWLGAINLFKSNGLLIKMYYFQYFPQQPCHAIMPAPSTPTIQWLKRTVNPITLSIVTLNLSRAVLKACVMYYLVHMPCESF